MAFNVSESKTTNPNATPLMIMPGPFRLKQSWRGISKALESKTKRKIYSVDARNHGDSPHTPDHNSACMAGDMKFLMYEENLRKISVLGHSMGGKTVMNFALKYPDLVEKTVVIDISPFSPNILARDIENILCAMKNINVSPDFSLADGQAFVVRQIKEMFPGKKYVDIILPNLTKLKSGKFVWKLNVSVLHSNYSHFRDQPINMPPFEGPVLFIAGKRSNFINPADIPKIKELFPNAEIEWLDGGHFVHLYQPEKFMELVSNFLNS